MNGVYMNHLMYVDDLNVNVNVEVYSLKSPWVQQTLQFTPLVLELSLLYGLISSVENKAHFLQVMPFTIFQFSFHQLPITAGWTEAVWYERFSQHLYTSINFSDIWELVNIPCATMGYHCDHLVLIAPSVCTLRVLPRNFASFARDNDVKYNAKKTVCMFVRSKELKSDFVPCFEQPGFKLKCVPTHKYLGVCYGSPQATISSYKGQTLFRLDNFISGPRSTYMKTWFRNFRNSSQACTTKI